MVGYTLDINITVLFVTEHTKILIHQRSKAKQEVKYQLSQININQLKYTIPNYSVDYTNTILDCTIKKLFQDRTIE